MKKVRVSFKRNFIQNYPCQVPGSIIENMLSTKHAKKILVLMYVNVQMCYIHLNSLKTILAEVSGVAQVTHSYPHRLPAFGLKL